VVFLLTSSGQVSWSSFTPPAATGGGGGGGGGGMPDDGGPGSWTMGTPVAYTALDAFGEIVKIAAGSTFCGFTGSGTLACTSLWADFDSLPVTSLPDPAAVAVPQVTGTVAELAVGYDYDFSYGESCQCMRFAGPSAGKSVYCWGDDYNGALGVGGPEYPASAVLLPAFPSPVVSLTAGEMSTTAVLHDGSSRFWGSGVTYISNGVELDAPSPYLVNLGMNNTALRMNDSQQIAYALKDGGTPPDLVNNGTVSPPSPQRLQTYPVQTFSDVQPGFTDLGLLSADAGAQLIVFAQPLGGDPGGNDCGIFGNGTQITPDGGALQPVPNLTASLFSYWAGNYYACPVHACAVELSGVLVCWGSNGSGESGYSSLPATPYVTTPNPVTLPGATHAVTSVAAGLDFTCATDGPPPGSGKVYCWGANDYGQLGLSSAADFGPATTTTTPAAVVGIMNGGGTSPAVALSAGEDHVCALLQNGTVMCWGCNDYGQLGNGDYTDQGAPGPVMGLASDVIQVSAGYHHTCAVHTGGTVSCWGSSYIGQAGIGAMIEGQLAAPTMVQGLP
jgi:alpha-tubulin suppressor-like RCC1 family protein